MTNQAPVRQTKFVVFDEASMDEERMAAVLVTKDGEGRLRAYVKDVPGRNAPDPEVVGMLVQAVELANF